MKFRLSSVLSARRAQENAAKAAALRARQDAAAAQERVRRMDAAIDARPRPDATTAAAFAATLWARQAMAAELSAAVAVAAQSESVVGERAEELTAAATRRRSVEKLGERHDQAQRDAADEVAERAADDLITSRNRKGKG